MLVLNCVLFTFGPLNNLPCTGDDVNVTIRESSHLFMLACTSQEKNTEVIFSIEDNVVLHTDREVDVEMQPPTKKQTTETAWVCTQVGLDMECSPCRLGGGGARVMS